ncbi:hypothetical protein DC31_07155 [Microbacterium sp. CH12i]|uniref:hypothetical protein n=1 Tax=Microbacterium sp. CH12i TaxID=1479651 RepID=UPI00046105AF|nr:hypothetical protein [Microbacterium sp. CH12i]KDA06780.1 hypothetical protein DC31_07155 [Microbacterium sp. CH12i]
MKGKIGLVIGVGVGYVLGTRAGRERYEQIKTQWLKVWHLDPVQDQVTKAKAFVSDRTAAVPGAIWNGVVKVAKAAGNAKTPGQKLDSVIVTGKEAVDDVAAAADEVVAKAEKPITKRAPAKKPTTNGK